MGVQLGLSDTRLLEVFQVCEMLRGKVVESHTGLDRKAPRARHRQLEQRPHPFVSPGGHIPYEMSTEIVPTEHRIR
ncbi:hypothetical protein HNP40_000455 [Mycobacteroides chelonae]|nr:hypothetical protein [Mycobacteroides chelonae]